MDSVKALVSQATGSPVAGEDSGFMEDIQGRLTMSRKHRLYGFAACLGFGVFFLFISTTLFIMPTKFAVTYTLANILLMGSTMFLIGPIKQLKLMFDPVRFFATVAYLLSLVLALVCALKLRNFFLTIIAIIIEAVAIAWESSGLRWLESTFCESCDCANWCDRTKASRSGDIPCEIG